LSLLSLEVNFVHHPYQLKYCNNITINGVFENYGWRWAALHRPDRDAWAGFSRKI